MQITLHSLISMSKKASWALILLGIILPLLLAIFDAARRYIFAGKSISGGALYWAIIAGLAFCCLGVVRLPYSARLKVLIFLGATLAMVIEILFMGAFCVWTKGLVGVQ